jgi:hypothetical protein
VKSSTKPARRQPSPVLHCCLCGTPTRCTAGTLLRGEDIGAPRHVVMILSLPVCIAHNLSEFNERVVRPWTSLMAAGAS